MPKATSVEKKRVPLKVPHFIRLNTGTAHLQIIRMR
jgi:hypothetical protein